MKNKKKTEIFMELHMFLFGEKKRQKPVAK